jgi:hypothetical protein
MLEYKLEELRNFVDGLDKIELKKISKFIDDASQILKGKLKQLSNAKEKSVKIRRKSSIDSIIPSLRKLFDKMGTYESLCDNQTDFIEYTHLKVDRLRRKILDLVDNGELTKLEGDTFLEKFEAWYNSGRKPFDFRVKKKGLLKLITVLGDELEDIKDESI